MRIFKARLRGITNYSQSKKHFEPKLDKESADQYEKRTWRAKAHIDEQGRCFIPAMSVKQAMDTAAKRLSIPIKGKGKATYTKNVVSGVLVLDNLTINGNLGVHQEGLASAALTIDGLREEVVHCNADGIRGSGKRVFRHFPVVDKGWGADIEVTVVDDEIPNEVVERCLKEAGQLVGIGRFRAEKGGLYGRFKVEGGTWETA